MNSVDPDSFWEIRVTSNKGKTMQKTFLIGLGAQKAGTTWVYRYLREHPDCAMGNIKEMGSLRMHFGGEKNKKRRINHITWLSSALEKAEQDLRGGKLSSEHTQFLLDRMENVAADLSFDHYIRYFSTLFQQKPGAMLTGDITPEYGLMSRSELERTKLCLEKAGYRVKALFMMRDPVERCFSAIRMVHRQALQNGDRIQSFPHQGFAEKAIKSWHLERSQYEKTVPVVESVFPPEDRFFGFFETFFSTENISDLCGFLGISEIEANLAMRINASPRDEEPSTDEWEEVRAVFKETYDYCAGKFGTDLISSIWNYKV